MLMDEKTQREWEEKHNEKYHGSYADVLERNREMWEKEPGTLNLDSVNLFNFNPSGKVICDIGAGGGWHGLECIRKGAQKVYLIEVNDLIIQHMSNSFQELNIPVGKYQILGVVGDYVDLKEKMDVIYCMAVFQHIHIWQAVSWFKWTARNLKEDGEAHFQFYQPDRNSHFFNSEEVITLDELEWLLSVYGLKVKNRELATSSTNPDFLPVWYLYHCTKEVVNEL